MINRVINTLIKANVAVSVVDCACAVEQEPRKTYRHLGIRYWKAALLSKVVWPIVRRVGGLWLREQFWYTVAHLIIVVNALRMGRLAAGGKPDNYLACDLPAAVAGLFAKRLSTSPVIYMAYEIESEQGFGESARVQQKVRRTWESLVLPRVDYLVAPNQARADFYAQHHRLRKPPVVVRNCPPWLDVAKEKRLHTQLELPWNTKVVLYHGALIPYRALDNLVKSAEFFAHGTVLVMIGKQGEYYKSALLPLLDSVNLKHRVFFLPYISPAEIMDFVASADLGVVIYENVNLNNYLCAPMKLYEFIMLGVPIIACDYPEPRDVIRLYGVGVTVESTDPQVIAATVNEFFAKKTESGIAADVTFSKARQSLNWEIEGGKLMSLLMIKELQ